MKHIFIKRIQDRRLHHEPIHAHPQSILDLARHGPAEIWMGARNLDKAREAADNIKKQIPDAPPIKLLKIDLESLDSVKQAAKTFLAQATRLDILMLNAGIMATPPGQTADGYEIQWATNYLGHALLAKLLLPNLLPKPIIPPILTHNPPTTRSLIILPTLHPLLPRGRPQLSPSPTLRRLKKPVKHLDPQP